MRLVFFSGTHPDTKHISGIRAARFAHELARAGHQCALLCPTLDEKAHTRLDPRQFGIHDWATPLIVPIRARESTSRLPALFKPAATALNVVRFGGNKHELYRAMIVSAEQIALHFPPDAAWATFGTLETVMATSRFAGRAGIPWVFDVKDNPDLYVPRFARRHLARQFGGCGALTSNAELHAQAAEKWLRRPAEVIFSSVEDAFFTRRNADLEHPYVTLSGGLYHQDRVDAFVAGVAAHNRLTRAPLKIIYMGSQIDMLEQAARHHSEVEIENFGYVETCRMAHVCQAAMANAYIFFGRGFHHKLFELLACNRPVIAFGGELPESKLQAANLDKRLETPESSSGLSDILNDISFSTREPATDSTDKFFLWSQQAACLEKIFGNIIRS